MELEDEPYRAEERDGGHRVTDGKGATVFACGDRTGAERYAAVLNEAWKRGYKAGYRAGRGA